jgi:uncharacterized membrane protein
MQKRTGHISIFGFEENLTAALGYLMGIGALVLVFAEKDNRFIRFHALQSVLYSAGLSAVLMALIIFFNTSDIQYSLFYLTVFCWMIGMIYAVVMAFRTRNFKFPVIGEIAGRCLGVNLDE